MSGQYRDLLLLRDGQLAARSARTGETHTGAKLIPIVSLASEASVKTSAKTVGFVFPHYASSLPKIVHTFIEKLDLDSAAYLFAIVNQGPHRDHGVWPNRQGPKEKGQTAARTFRLYHAQRE